MSTNRTERLYYSYASPESFDAKILELRPVENGMAHIIMDKTIFYPEGGGQPADRGTVNGMAIVDVQEKNGEIVHVVNQDCNSAELGPGPAKLVLDNGRRRDITAQHTGQHLLSGIIFRMTGSNTVSMHLGDETCTVDIAMAEMSASLLLEIEDAVADAIEKNLPIMTHICPPENIAALPLRKFPPQGEDVIRVVEITGIDFSPCCGTHFISTAEIGMLRILSAEKYKGMTRITFIAGRRVLEDSRLLRHNAVLASHALNVPPAETGKAVTEFLEKSAQLERRLKLLEEIIARQNNSLPSNSDMQLKLLEEIIARQKATALLDKVPPCDSASQATVIEYYKEESIAEILSIGKAIPKEAENRKTAGAMFVLASARELKVAIFCTVKGFDLRTRIKAAFENQGGKGGGGPSFFQGSFTTKESLEAFLLEMKNC
ncbi:MAG: alanyl-tRNA editing protein [Treponema sp.]|nr:alanyl-tRNA editing protein [Treponema sp.]